MTEENKALSTASFVPAVKDLKALVEKAKGVDIKSLDQVHDVRIELRDARVNITKQGKQLRDDAVKFQKDVIAKEKELIAIITPEEERLEKAEDELKLRIEMEKRKDELPSRLAALVSVGDELPIDEAEILAMTDTEFNEYRLRRIDAKLVADKAAHEAKVKKEEEDLRKKRAEEDRIRREQLEKDEREAAEKRRVAEEVIAKERAELDKEKARLEGEKKAREEAEAAKMREIERQEREAKLKADQEKEAADKKAKEEQDALREKKFTDWLETIGYNKDTDNVQTDGKGKIKVWRLIATYDPAEQK